MVKALKVEDIGIDLLIEQSTSDENLDEDNRRSSHCDIATMKRRYISRVAIIEMICTSTVPPDAP